MTTITDFIKYLKSLPSDTEISVIESYDCGYSTCVRETLLNIDPIIGNVDYTDLTGNMYVKESDSRFNKKYLVLGEL